MCVEVCVCSLGRKTGPPFMLGGIKNNRRPPAPDFRRAVNSNAISGHWDTPLRPKCKQFEAFSGHGKKKKRWGPRPHPDWRVPSFFVFLFWIGIPKYGKR